MTVLPEACARLSATLPAAWHLTTQPDTDGTRSARQPASRPPWNTAAADAALTAHEGIRRLLAAMQMDAGLPARRKGGADTVTIQALREIMALETAVTTSAAAQAARILDRWATAVDQLPAVDLAERWQGVQHACPYCRMPNSLRAAPRSGRVTCIRYGACRDSDGRHPVGQMEVGRLGACVTWADGLVT